jgi:cytochrome P450
MGQNLKPLATPYPCTWKDYLKNPLGVIAESGQEWGEIVALQYDDEQPFYLLTAPEDITEVLKNQRLFIRSEISTMLREVVGNGLIASEGHYWQQQRRLLQPLFSPQYINNYANSVVSYTQRMLQTWQAGKVVDVHQEMTDLTLDLIIKKMLSLDSSCDLVRQLAHCLKERDFPATIPLIDRITYGAINDRRASKILGEDLLGMLMQLQQAQGAADDNANGANSGANSGTNNSGMSDRQLRDEVASLLIAGHDTTANSLSWAWMELANHPKVYQKLIAEITEVLAGCPPTTADRAQLTYTNQVIKEVLRLYPPLRETNRKATQDCQIGDYFIPEGTQLIISPWITHRNQQYFPDPLTFEPARWQNDLEKQLPNGAYLPFGYGPHSCLGKGFALMEMMMVLVAITQQFHLELVPEHVIKIGFHVTVYPKRGIKVLLSSAQ